MIADKAVNYTQAGRNTLISCWLQVIAAYNLQIFVKI